LPLPRPVPISSARPDQVACIIEHAIAPGHLPILREPHVRGLAAVLEREIG
jgi:hypothetical protein